MMGSMFVLICFILFVWKAVNGQACVGTDVTRLDEVVFATEFFHCYTSDISSVGQCFVNATSIGTSCSSCIQTASNCLNSTCGSCESTVITPQCVTCATSSCQTPLQTCSGQNLVFNPCTTFLCNQPAWVLPVIIAGSVLGFFLLLLAIYGVCLRDRDQGCLDCSCGRCCCLSGQGSGRSCFGSPITIWTRFFIR